MQFKNFPPLHSLASFCRCWRPSLVKLDSCCANVGRPKPNVDVPAYILNDDAGVQKSNVGVPANITGCSRIGPPALASSLPSTRYSRFGEHGFCLLLLSLLMSALWLPLAAQTKINRKALVE